MNKADKLSKKDYDPIKVLQIADSFYLAAERCGEYRPIAPNSWQMLSVPKTTNRAFACELYLKSILFSMKNFISGHNLYNLWESLPADIQMEIKKECPCAPNTTFEESLSSIKLSFKEWRYIFEYREHSIEETFLYYFAMTLKKFAYEIVNATPPTSPSQCDPLP